MKDDINIFHLVPSKPVSDHWNCHTKVQKKMAWSCKHQKGDTSPVLSYSTITPIQQGDKMKKMSAAKIANGSLMNCYGTRTIKMKLSDKCFSTPAIIID